MQSPQSLPASHNGGWDTPEVALAQRALVDHELAQDVRAIPPYAAFLRAMAAIKPAPLPRLLDVGCGAGHYATLIRRHFADRHIRYVGMDSSAAMIAQAQAREPSETFVQRDIAATLFDRYEIVLHSLAAECAPHTLGLLSLILREADQWIIWHRIRLAGDNQTGYFTEATYAGHSGKIWLWDQQDLVGFLNLSGRRYLLQTWPERHDCLTAVIFPVGMAVPRS